MRRIAVFLLLIVSASAEQVPFRRAIELAVRNSRLANIAQAEQAQAESNYYQQRNLFLPQMVVGSGLGYSLGFPLSLEGSAPSLVNVNSQQLLLNFPQRDFVKAAQRSWTAATYQRDNRRSDVVLETATVYAELDKVATSLSLLRQQEQVAARIETIARERFAAGVDTQLDVTRAQLAVARLRLRATGAESAAQGLRLRLSQLTGLPADSIETVTESIPQISTDAAGGDLIGRALNANAAVKVAEEQAASKELTARGSGKWMYPAMDLVGQYAMLSRHNNYDEFYQRFERHNATVGLAIRLPFLNFSAKSQADAAAAEATKARHQAEMVKEQVSSETQRLQGLVRQLAAARDVAKLEHQLARSDAEAAAARAEAGEANIRDQENAKLIENDRYTALLDAEFDLQKAQLQLLRTIGELESWATGGSQ